MQTNTYTTLSVCLRRQLVNSAFKFHCETYQVYTTQSFICTKKHNFFAACLAISGIISSLQFLFLFPLTQHDDWSESNDDSRRDCNCMMTYTCVRTYLLLTFVYSNIKSARFSVEYGAMICRVNHLFANGQDQESSLRDEWIIRKKMYERS